MNNIKKILHVLLLLLFTHLACAVTFADTLTGSLRNYVLGPNDIINISVTNLPELKQDNVRIQPDGRIVISPTGSINVSGLSIDDLHQKLYTEYAKYIKNPQISVTLSQSRPFIVYVTGAVLNPGSYELNTNTASTEFMNSSKPEIQIERKTPLLTNILVAAGGITHDADLEHIQVNNSVTHAGYTLNLLNLLDKGDTKQDLYLMAGDTVYVPKLPSPMALSDEKYKKYASATFSPHSVPVKVLGYVNTPGLIRLDPAQSLNLNSAITSAGGYLNNAAYAPKAVYLSRMDNNGKLVTRVVNPMNSDVVLMPNDMVYVPEKVRPLIGKSFDFVERIVSPVNSVAGSYNNWALMFNPGRLRY